MVFFSISQSPTSLSPFSDPFGNGDINLVGNSGANNLHINDVSTNQNIASLSAVRYFDMCAFVSGVWWPFPAYVRHDADERRAGHASNGKCNIVAFPHVTMTAERFYLITRADRKSQVRRFVCFCSADS